MRATMSPFLSGALSLTAIGPGEKNPAAPHPERRANTVGVAALVDRWAEFQRAPGHRAILMALNPRAHTQATADLLSAIKAPTLILHGESDVLIEPASARKFAAAIPGAKLITYPHVGHLPQIEIPERSAADAAAFLEAHAAQP
jgi:pimeloyl-ACP methyl ester carboxylesterase